jgi:hypothetical protein
MTKNKLSKGDKAMLAAARMQILLEKNIQWFTGPSTGTAPICQGILQECHDIIKKAKIPKKYLLAESLDESTNKT